MQDKAAFTSVIQQAVPLATAGKLVTLGIVPQSAQTGCGYIQRGEKQGAGYAVKNFVEKANKQTAQEYLDGGRHYWNCGMFLFKVSHYLEELNTQTRYRAGLPSIP